MSGCASSQNERQTFSQRAPAVGDNNDLDTSSSELSAIRGRVSINRRGEEESENGVGQRKRKRLRKKIVKGHLGEQDLVLPIEDDLSRKLEINDTCLLYTSPSPRDS